MALKTPCNHMRSQACVIQGIYNLNHYDLKFILFLLLKKHAVTIISIDVYYIQGMFY